MTTNLWAQFQGLLPGSPLLVAQIVTVDTDGSSVLELPGGEQFKARGGTGLDTGDWVYVREGEIRGPAPAVTVGADLIV
jgi:hypothetical protein